MTDVSGPPEGSRNLMQVAATLDAVFDKINTMFIGSSASSPRWKDLFRTLTHDTGFVAAMNATVMLYLVVFGIMVLFNLVDITWYEAFIRILKIAIMYYLIVGGGVSIIIQSFFIGGMNELITAYYTATVGSLNALPRGLNVGLHQLPNTMLTNAPLNFLIVPLQMVMDIRFIMVILSMMFAGLSGFVLMLFLIQGTFFFLLAALGALATYVKALIGLFVLFAISPIFIVCLLFDQTRRLFDGWFNLCLSFALQPVFVFAFLGFFMTMIAGVLKPILEINVCYGPFWDMEIAQIWWFFPVSDSFAHHATANDVLGYVSNRGGNSPIPIATDLWQKANMQIHMVDVLMFVLLSSLSWRYSSYVQQIASELSGGNVSITTSGQELAAMAQRNGIDPMGMAQRAAGSVSGAGSAMMKMATGAMGEGAKQGESMMETLKSAAGEVRSTPGESPNDILNDKIGGVVSNVQQGISENGPKISE